MRLVEFSASLLHRWQADTIDRKLYVLREAVLRLILLVDSEFMFATFQLLALIVLVGAGVHSSCWLLVLLQTANHLHFFFHPLPVPINVQLQVDDPLIRLGHELCELGVVFPSNIAQYLTCNALIFCVELLHLLRLEELA